MPSTILQIAQDAADDLDLERPESDTIFEVYNEGDVTNLRLVRAITRTCQFLAAKYDWQMLRKEHTFDTVSGEAQTAWKPADFLRFVPETMQDRTRRLPIIGPLSSSEWQAHKALLFQQTTPAFYQRGDVTYLAHYPSVGATLAFEYIKNAVGVDSDDADVARFSAATDKAFFDDELMTLGTVYHYRKARSMAHATEELDFNTMVQDRIKQDGGKRRINMNGGGATSDSLAANLKSRIIAVEVSS